MTTLTQVIEQLEQMATSDLIEIYNGYADANSYERIYDNDEHTINECYDSAFYAIRGAIYGDYNPSDAYFIFNGAANLESFSYETDNNCPIDLEELAEWIISEGNHNSYDIEVVTIDDKNNAVYDAVNDIDSVDNIIMLLNELTLDYESLTEHLAIDDDNDINSFINDNISFIQDAVFNDEELLNIAIEYLGIDL